MGSMDPEPIMKEYAAIDKIIEEAQKQYDEFLANKNKQ